MNSNQFEGTIKDIGGQAEEAIGNTFDNTKTKVAGMVDSAKGKVQSAYGTVRDKAQDIAGEAPEYVERAKEAGRRAAQTSREYADKATETVKTQVQEQPVTTLLGGIAVGFVLGWLINSRRS